MKKLLTILLLFAACALKAQYTPNSGAYSYKGLMPLKSLQLPTDCGYPVTAIHAPDSSRSAIYFDSCNALLYRFDPKPKTWSVILDSVGAGSIVTLQLAYDGSIAAGDDPAIDGGGQGRTMTIENINYINLKSTPSGGNSSAFTQLFSTDSTEQRYGVVSIGYSDIAGDTSMTVSIAGTNQLTGFGNTFYIHQNDVKLFQFYGTGSDSNTIQIFSHPPIHDEGIDYYIPVTVNGVRSDSAGNIQIGGGSVSNGLLQPGYVTWSGSGLTFDVTAGSFVIDGTQYTGNAGSITLDPADPTFPRFDVIGWDTTGAVIKVTGTAGMNPAIPQVDPSYQIGLTVINIPAGATVPGGITQDVIYDENNEDWTGAVSGITVNLDNTTNPYHLTKSADAGTWSPAPKTLTFTNDTGYIDANDYGILKLFISLKESIAAVGNIRVSFLNDGDAVSNIVSLGGGVGFNKSIADTYQNISVPLSSFIFTSTVFNQVRITFAGSGDGAYIDYIQLQGGITPPSIAGVYQDTTYSRNDSLFGRKNNTEFFIQHLTLARLPQLWGIYINNDDSTYDPYGVDVGIGVDSALLKDWIINTVIDNDTTITTVLDDLDYVVDTISNDPPVGVAEGYKVLVGTSPTGDFAGHENEIATLVGSVWTFEVPAANETLEVHNSTQLLFYKYTGVDWILQAVPALIGGNTGLVEPDIGTTDANSFTIKTNNTDAIVIDTLQNVKLPMFANLEDSSIYFRPGEDGKVDTGYFNQLIAGTGITITPGPNRTDTIKSTGGGSVTVETGGNSGIDSNLVYDGGTFRKASPLGYLNIMDYGGINDSTGNNYTAITDAIAALPASGGIIYFPPGIYKVETQIVVDKAVTFLGAGAGMYPDYVWVPATTKITTSSGTLDLFKTTVKNVVFKDLCIYNASMSTPSEGAAIYAEQGTGMKISYCTISGFYNLIRQLNAGEWFIDHTNLEGMVNAAVIVRDSITPDDGDGTITNCMINARRRDANYGIYQLSGGGLRLVNNKFNHGYEGNQMGFGYYGAFEDTTGNLLINGNSFENYTNSAIYLDPGVDVKFFNNVVITGNQIAHIYPRNGVDIRILNHGSDQHSNLTIMGNTFSGTINDTAIQVYYNWFNVAIANSYQTGTKVIYGTNTINTLFDDNKITGSVEMGGVQVYTPSANPLTLSMGGTLGNNNSPTNDFIKLRLYNDGTAANRSGFGVTGSSVFNMFGWAANGWGYIQYVNNGTQAFRAFSSGGVEIGSASSETTSAQLSVTSTTKGLLLPRMTKAQRDAISSPVAGLAVYQTDNTPGLRVYNGTNWMRYTETAD